MRIIILSFVFTVAVLAQNNHLNHIDFEYLDYTRTEIEDGYKDHGEFWIVKNEPGILSYQGGKGFVSWPLYLTTYYFDKNDSLYQIEITLDDASENDVYVFPNVLMTFRNWYGNEVYYREEENGNRYYYWYFGREMQEADVMMTLVKNFKTKEATQITQIHLSRVMEAEDGQE